MIISSFFPNEILQRYYAIYAEGKDIIWLRISVRTNPTILRHDPVTVLLVNHLFSILYDSALNFDLDKDLTAKRGSSFQRYPN